MPLLELSLRNAKFPQMSESTIPYSRPTALGNELKYLEQVLSARHFRGDGEFTKKCNAWLEKTTGTGKALLTHSCTAAMELTALLTDLAPGDEVIMPSFTFVSTANAVALRGAKPVFVDIRPDTLNLDEKLIEAAITPKTKAIFVVHYAGVACEMDTIIKIAKDKKLLVFEDAAQGLLASYKGRALGTLGQLGSLSFHDTKNIVSGEGGALLINDASFAERADIIREKGTNRAQFFRGQVDKYTWVDIGSSFLPSEFNAAVLLAQFELAEPTTRERITTWKLYHSDLADAEAKGHINRPTVPAECQHNGHIYYILCRDLSERTAMIQHLKSRGISAPFHYVPLHSAPAGLKFGRTQGQLRQTESLAERQVRLPLWTGMTEAEVGRVTEAIFEFYQRVLPANLSPNLSPTLPPNLVTDRSKS